MNWILDGQRVRAQYMGSYPVTGTVVESRVKYGGDVSYTIALDHALELFGRRREPGERVSVNRDQAVVI